MEQVDDDDGDDLDGDDLDGDDLDSDDLDGDHNDNHNDDLNGDHNYHYDKHPADFQVRWDFSAKVRKVHSKMRKKFPKLGKFIRKIKNKSG